MQILKKYPIYRKFILNNFISTLGDSMYYIALMTYAAQFAKPGLAIAMVTMSEALPGIFYIVTGSLADMSLNKTQKTIISGVIRGVLYFIVGILIGFKSSLMILSGIVLINFISDLLGKYSGGLMTPFVLYIVKKEDIEAAQGLSGATTQTVGLLAQFVGAFLMGIFSYQLLAWLNSITFFLSAVVIYSISKVLTKIEKEKIAPSHVAKTVSLKTMWQQIKSSLREIKAQPTVFQPILMFAVANGGLSVLLPLLSLLLAQQADLVFKSFAFSLALFQGILSLGLISGNLFGPRLLRHLSLQHLCQSIFISLVLTALAYLSQQGWLIMLALLLIGLLIGSASPKLNVLIVTSFPVEKLATVSGGVNTLLSLAPPLGTTVFTTVAALKLNYALVLLVIFGLGSFILNFFLSLKNQNSDSAAL